jgi:hypothetical protein
MKFDNHQYLGSRDSLITGCRHPHSIVSREADLEAWCRVMGGRLGAVAAVLAFIVCYLDGIAKYGLLLGIGIGWLPSGIIAWLTTHAVAALGTGLLRSAIVGSRYLSARLDAIKLHR